MPLDDAQQFENHIPEAVRRQVERAEAIVRQLSPAAEPEDAGEAEPAATEPVAAEPAPAAPAAPPAPPPAEDWEQRYRTLQGKYDAETAQMRARLVSLENLLSTMQQPAREPAAPARSTAETTTVVIPPEDEQAYGADLIQAARRWAMAEVQPHIARLEETVRRLESGQQRVEVNTSQQRVEIGLDNDAELNGKWRAINQDPAFIAWLNDIDPFAGVKRFQLLTDACSRGDAVRVGKFFKAYIAEHTAVAPAPAPAPATPAPTPAAAAPTLESLAAPGRAAGPVPGSGAPAEKRVWSNREITAFYRDVQQGKYAGREADKIRIETDILAAASEGRVR